MRRILLLLFSFFCIVFLYAQDDTESVLSADIEIDGFESFWVKSELISDNFSESGSDCRAARPFGGTVMFLSHVHEYTTGLFTVLTEKYPEEMLSLIGTSTSIFIEFIVDKDGTTSLKSVTNGAMFGFDAKIAQKLLSSYKKKWRPAVCNGEKISCTVTLRIDVSV